jgi:hypothetical protein
VRDAEQGRWREVEGETNGLAWPVSERKERGKTGWRGKMG